MQSIGEGWYELTLVDLDATSMGSRSFVSTVIATSSWDWQSVAINTCACKVSGRASTAAP